MLRGPVVVMVKCLFCLHTGGHFFGSPCGLPGRSTLPTFAALSQNNYSRDDPGSRCSGAFVPWPIPNRASAPGYQPRSRCSVTHPRSICSVAHPRSRCSVTYPTEQMLREHSCNRCHRNIPGTADLEMVLLPLLPQSICSVGIYRANAL